MGEKQKKKPEMLFVKENNTFLFLLFIKYRDVHTFVFVKHKLFVLVGQVWIGC